MNSGVRLEASEVKLKTPLISMPYGELLRIFLAGALVGLIVGVMIHIMAKAVFTPMLCSSGSSACKNVVAYSSLIAMLVGSVSGLIVLAKLKTYRSLLVMVMSTLSMWGYCTILAESTAWFWSLVLGIVLFGVAYALFGWLARIRSFLVAFSVSAIALVIIRIFL
ncbi:hypothetical protein CR956_00710 [Candidatus Saccharibacteria bacterium]|nr:MAG: hypothetical protein CR956_00710 [Candidatus Saccharibacteria bacterium]